MKYLISKDKWVSFVIRKGLVGIVVAVMVVSFLILVMTTGITVVQTETTNSKSYLNIERAKAAAMSGVFYYMACLLATSSTFDTSKRLHFLSQSNRNSYPPTGAANTNQQIATYSSGTGENFSALNVATSTWLYPHVLDLCPPDADDVPSSSIFIIKTYVDNTNLNTLASYVYIKSLGCYREIENSNVIASYYSQIIARIEINNRKKTLALTNWRYMPIQYPNNENSDFHRNLILPFK